MGFGAAAVDFSGILSRNLVERRAAASIADIRSIDGCLAGDRGHCRTTLDGRAGDRANRKVSGADIHHLRIGVCHWLDLFYNGMSGMGYHGGECLDLLRWTYLPFDLFAALHRLAVSVLLFQMLFTCRLRSNGQFAYCKVLFGNSLTWCTVL